MARVTLIGPLKSAIDGPASFDLDALSIGQLLQRLAARHPELAPLIEAGVAVAVDGLIYQDAWLAEIALDSDVHILPPIAGG